MTSEAQAQLPPREFVDQVASALEHLYDFSYLQSHPLARAGSFNDQRPGEMDGQCLRRHLLEAIQTLNPGQGIPFLSPHARLYNLLRMHYVDGMTLQKVAHELGISMRQSSRNLRQAETSIAAILWSRQRDTTLPVIASAEAGMESSSHGILPAEIEPLEMAPRSIDIRQVVDHACQAVQELARKQQVVIQLAMPQEPVVIWADPVAAKQVLISLVSRVTQYAGQGALSVELASVDKQALVTLRYIASSSVEAGESTGVPIDPMVALLASELEWTITQSELPDHTRATTIEMSSRGSTVLIIDDNAGLARLMERYLTGQPCRVVAVQDGLEGLHLAEQLAPDAIVLDVMMPELDGWEILRALRHGTSTAEIPVVICSVLHNPELAASLGATAYLVKPIRREDVLGALSTILGFDPDSLTQMRLRSRPQAQAAGRTMRLENTAKHAT